MSMIPSKPNSPPETSLNLWDNFRYCMIKKFCYFGGRASRAEFWKYALVSTLLSLPYIIVMGFVVVVFLGPLGLIVVIFSIYGIIFTLFTVAIMLNNLALLIRRLHDVNRSGYLIWLLLIPVIGALILLYILCKEGTVGTNKYGEPPTYLGIPDTLTRGCTTIRSLALYLLQFIGSLLLLLILCHLYFHI